jgi:hypothetical protein
MYNIPDGVLITSVYFVNSSVTLNKLYYTHFYLSSSFGSAKSHHQAINKNYKNGDPVCSYNIQCFQFCNVVSGLIMALY